MSSSKGYRNDENDLPNSLFLAGKTSSFAKYMNINKIFWFCFGMSSSKGYRNDENNLPIHCFWQTKLPALLNDILTLTKYFLALF